MSKLKELDVWKIEDPPVILHPKYELDELFELAESIKKQGLINPIVVRRHGEHYQLVSGYRRLMAARKFNIPKLLCRIMDMDEKDAMIASATENILREDQDIIQEAKLYKKLIENHGLTKAEIAEKFGKSEVYVDTRLKILGLPIQIQEAVRDKELPLGSALAVTKAPTEEEKILLASEIAKCGYNVKEAQLFVSSYLEHRKHMTEAPKEEVVRKAEEEPMATCAICKLMKRLATIRAYPMCDECYEEFIYMRQKAMREALKERRA